MTNILGEYCYIGRPSVHIHIILVLVASLIKKDLNSEDRIPCDLGPLPLCSFGLFYELNKKTL